MPRNQDGNGEFGGYVTISFYVKYLCIYIYMYIYTCDLGL